MRTTISIPDKFYNRIRERMESLGFGTINDFILDLLRHQFDAEMDLQKIDPLSIPPAPDPMSSNNIKLVEESVPVGLSGKGKTCPICGDKIAVELIRKHYDNKHEGI